MVQPEQPQPQRLPLFFRLRTARTANTRIHAKIKMSSTVPIFFPFSESGNHRRMRPAPSTGSRASGLRQSFQGWPRCFAPLFRLAPLRVASFGAAERLRRCPHPSVLRTLCCGPLHPAGRCGLRGCGAASPLSSPLGASHPLLRPAPPCGALRASGLRSGFAAVLTPRCFAPLLRPAPPCGALRASGLRSGFAAVLTPRCFAPLLRPVPSVFQTILFFIPAGR